ncbi:hypothetical protein RJ639_012200 [Escallonia herrerae]|uniref:RING-type E3 ubiquitin transferase n=1 Tax=Escallonia herrerae TaxID=1293975 RepID=A0AA89AN41_9ASTE|nr:hypothetical protein RJ639_012200 [Escallonia herrerae]
MVDIRQESRVTSIRVFKGNNILQVPPPNAHGILVFLVNTKTRYVAQRSNGHNVEQFTAESTYENRQRFHKEILLNPVSMQRLVFQVALKEYTMSPVACSRLAAEISTKLFSRFRFTPETILHSRTCHHIKIVVEVDRRETLVYTLEESNALEGLGICGTNMENLDFEEEDGDEEEEEKEEEEGEAYGEVAALTVVQALDGNVAKGGCSICLASKFSVETVVAKLPCAHMFHRDCILPWLSKSNTCPMCRLICVASV